MSDEKPQPKHLDERLFKDERVVFWWLVFLFLVFICVSFPIRDCLLVCWVYGSDAYFHQGIRVVDYTPTQFSDGKRAPDLPDMITGFGAFFVTFLGPTYLLVAVLRLYERFWQKPRS